jgi:WD40 repeat protein
MLKDDRYVALAGLGSRILIWDLKLQKVKYKFREHFIKVTGLEELNNETLASGHTDGRILVWNIKSESQIYTLNIDANHYAVKSLKLLRNNYLAAGYEDGSIFIWDLNTNSIKWELREHHDEIIALDEFNNGDIVSASKDGKIFRWACK